MSQVTIDRELLERLVSGFEHVSGIARQWEPDHSSGKDRALWAKATEACADVVKVIQAAPAQPVNQVLVDDERALFEAHIAKDCGDLSTFGSGQNMHYCNSGVNHEWIGWKSRAALAQAQAQQT